MKKYFIILLVLILPYISLSQIKIEERVEILPGSINNILPDGSISGDSRNPVYIAYGGSVRVRAINASSFGTYELWEETYGRIPKVLTTVNLGVYPQWHKFVFYLLNPITQQKYYPGPGDLIVWDFPSTIDFYPSHQPGDPYPPNPEHWWEIRTVVDYSLAAMPPPEILNYFGNPFAQSQPLEVPIAGSLYAVIYPYTNADDALWIDLPETQLIQDDLKNHNGETFELGDMTAGEEIRFFLNSSNTIVSGSNLYPLSQVEDEPTPGGDILLWRLYFEDWTDLLFDDVVVEIYIRPEGEYPGNIAAIVEPEELAPGDTASITFKRRYLNGTLEDFREWRTFEIGMLDGCTLGNLLVDGTLGQYFYDVAQPVYFVVDPSANTGTVKLQVGLVGIGTRPIKNNLTNDTDKQINTENPKQKLDLKEITSTRREIRTKPVEENKKIYENNPPNKPENSNCPLLDFIAPVPSNFEFNVGDECDDLNLCVGVPYPEFVQYKMITSGGNNPDVCTPNTIDPITGNIQFQSGGFTALDWRPDNSQRISAEPCFDNENNNVQFKMVLTDAETNQNSPILKPEAILEVCEDNITSAGVILINSTEQLLNIIRLFPEQIPIIKADMDSVLSRYNAGIIKYKFRQEILVHESEHKKDYESYLASLKTDLLDGKVMDYSLTCEQFNLDPYATDYAKIEYLRIVKEYIKESNRIAGIEIDELKLHQRPSVQASLADYYILLYNYENRIIF